MGETIEKPKKTEAELLEAVRLQQEVLRQQAQAQKLTEQNDWFFALVNKASLKKVNEKYDLAEKNLKAAQEKVTELEIAMLMATTKEQQKLSKEKVKADKALLKANGDFNKASEEWNSTEVKAMKTGLATDTTKSDKAHEKAVAQAKFEPIYLDRLARSEEMLKQLETYLPASAQLVQAFNGAHTAAAELLKADPKPWEAAYKALHDHAHVSTALAEAEKLWEESGTAGRKAAPALFEEIDNLYERVAELRPLMTDEVRQSFVDRIEKAEAPLHVERVPQNVSQLSGLMLAEVVSGLLKVEKAATLAKGTAERQMTTVKEKLAGLDKLASEGAPGYTDMERATFTYAMNGAATNISLHEFTSASEVLVELTGVIDKRQIRLASDFEKVQATWADTYQANFPAQIIAATKIANDKTLPPSMQPNLAKQAGAIKDRLAKLLSVKPGVGVSFEAACAEAKSVGEALTTLDLAAKAAATFPAERERADLAIRRQIGETTTAITALENSLTIALGTVAPGGTRPDLAVVLGPLTQSLTAITTAWQGRMQNATSLAQLNEASCAAELTGLKLKAEQTASLGLDGAVTDAKLAPARAAYEKERAKAIRVAQDLISINPALGGGDDGPDRALRHDRQHDGECRRPRPRDGGFDLADQDERAEGERSGDGASGLSHAARHCAGAGTGGAQDPDREDQQARHRRSAETLCEPARNLQERV